MALTLRQNGLGQSNIVTASWWNDYYNLMTGAMNDQPVEFNYRPASSTATPALELATNGNAPLLLGLTSSGGTAFKFDASGNLTLTTGLITGNGASITVGNGTNDIVLAPGATHWTYLNNNNGGCYADQNGYLHGVAVFDNGSRVAIEGSHSSGQPIISYGSGVPGTLATNEIFIQVS